MTTLLTALAGCVGIYIFVGLVSYLMLDNDVQGVHGMPVLEMAYYFFTETCSAKDEEAVAAVGEQKLKLIILIFMILCWPTYTLMTIDDLEAVKDALDETLADLEAKIKEDKEWPCCFWELSSAILAGCF